MKNLLSLISFVAIALAASSAPEGNGDTARPNIVLFFVDDMGWADLGYRNAQFESPNIDQLSRDGMDFTQAYIPCPTCSPSRAALVTGKHPVRLRMVRHIPNDAANGFDEFGRSEKEFNLWATDPAQFPSRNWLPLEHTTYAEALGALGYYNQFVGKWHLGDEPFHPTKQGFDDQFGTSNAGHPKSYYPPYFKNSDVLADEKEAYLTDKLTDGAVEFIEGYDRDQPFMLSFWYYSVHGPFVGRKDYVQHFKDKGLESRDAQYAAMVKSVDDSVGRVMDSLQRQGLAENTIVLFLSDQGGAFQNGSLRGGKYSDTLYEGGARVPFIVKWPGVTDDSDSNPSIVQSTDLFPTLIEIAGGNPEEYSDIDGISILETITSGEPIQRERHVENQATYGKLNALVSQEHWPMFDYRHDGFKRDVTIGYRAYEDLYASVRHGDWKLLAYRSGKTELYNIAEDVSEKVDLKGASREHLLEAGLLTDDLVQFELDMGVYHYSGVKDRELLALWFLYRRFEPANITADQKIKIDALGDKLALEIRAQRHASRINPEIMYLRDLAHEYSRHQGLSGEALLRSTIDLADLTPQQGAGFRAIGELREAFGKTARALLTPQQKAKL